VADAQTCPYDTVDGYSIYAPVSTAASTLVEQNYPYVAAQFVSLRWLQERYPVHEVWFDCLLQGLHSIPAVADQGKSKPEVGNIKYTAEMSMVFTKLLMTVCLA
jgi:hypothetical protein